MNPSRHMAILIDMTHPALEQIGLDLDALHKAQTSFRHSPNLKQSVDETEMLVRTRDIPIEWLQAKAWYPAAVLAGPFDLDYKVRAPQPDPENPIPVEQLPMLPVYENWCVDVWGLCSKLDYATPAERQAYWRSRLPA